MYVYWWHVVELRAVKIGHADDPRQHVSDYRSEYESGGDDVRGYELDSGIDAEWVEGQLCHMLETNGVRRVSFWSRNGEEEFFALGDRTFEDTHELLHDAARHIVLAEVSNRRKRQRRHESQVAPIATAHQQEHEPNQVQEELRPDEHRTAAPSPLPAPARLWRYLVGAIVVGGLAIGLIGGDRMPGPRSANLAVQKDPLNTTASEDGGSSARALHDMPCTLVELSDTLVHVNCDRSWAWMRWDKRWMLASGHNENDALEFFNASDVARTGVALRSRESVPPLLEQVEAKPERFAPSSQPAGSPAPPPQSRPPEEAPQPATAKAPAPQRPDQTVVKPERLLPQSSQPGAPPAPPPQLRPLQESPRSVTAPPQPQPQPQPAPRREAAPPREQCTVSRPKPGFQVYLVTCPNSQAMIGRTVDSATGWTVAESVNATEAIEFFMKSPYAR